MAMKYTIDRINGNMAVCEDENGDLVKLMASELPSGVKEGDILKQQDGVWYKDETETGGLFLQKATHDLDYINYLFED